MLRRIPTKDEIDKVIETYHSHVDKGITFEMLKEARQKTYLGYMEIKKILNEYIDKGNYILLDPGHSKIL